MKGVGFRQPGGARCMVGRRRAAACARFAAAPGAGSSLPDQASERGKACSTHTGSLACWMRLACRKCKAKQGPGGRVSGRCMRAAERQGPRHGWLLAQAAAEAHPEEGAGKRLSRQKAAGTGRRPGVLVGTFWWRRWDGIPAPGTREGCIAFQQGWPARCCGRAGVHGATGSPSSSPAVEGPVVCLEPARTQEGGRPGGA